MYIAWQRLGVHLPQDAIDVGIRPALFEKRREAGLIRRRRSALGLSPKRCTLCALPPLPPLPPFPHCLLPNRWGGVEGRGGEGGGLPLDLVLTRNLVPLDREASVAFHRPCRLLRLLLWGGLLAVWGGEGGGRRGLGLLCVVAQGGILPNLAVVRVGGVPVRGGLGNVRKYWIQKLHRKHTPTHPRTHAEREGEQHVSNGA